MRQDNYFIVKSEGKGRYSGTKCSFYSVFCTMDYRTDIRMNLDKLFEKSELIPAIVKDADNGRVLMLAYMNRESLRKTIETGYTWFFSRSRQKLWNKGETSGNTQKVVNICADCDFDTLLVDVIPNGPACHTGKNSCFFNEVWTSQEGEK